MHSGLSSSSLAYPSPDYGGDHSRYYHSCTTRFDFLLPWYNVQLTDDNCSNDFPCFIESAGGGLSSVSIGRIGLLYIVLSG